MAKRRKATGRKTARSGIKTAGQLPPEVRKEMVTAPVVDLTEIPVGAFLLNAINGASADWLQRRDAIRVRLFDLAVPMLPPPNLPGVDEPLRDNYGSGFFLRWIASIRDVLLTTEVLRKYADPLHYGQFRTINDAATYLADVIPVDRRLDRIPGVA